MFRRGVTSGTLFLFMGECNCIWQSYRQLPVYLRRNSQSFARRHTTWLIGCDPLLLQLSDADRNDQISLSEFKDGLTKVGSIRTVQDGA